MCRCVAWPVLRLGPMVRRVACAVFLFAVAHETTARAEDDVDRVRTLYDEAGQLEKLGQWSAAQERLRAALRIRETPQLHYALGWAFENDDRLLEARVEYESAVRAAKGRGADGDEVKRLATTRLEEVDRLIPDVHVRAANAHVTIDGKPVPSIGGEATTKVDPGSRVIRVERNGQTVQQTVYVPRGISRIVEISADSTIVATDHDKKSNVLPWVLVGVGGALVVTSAALFISSSSDASERDSKQASWCQATACAGSLATLPETTDARQNRLDSQDAADRGNTKQIAGAVIGALGLTSAIVGTVILVKRGGEKPLALRIDGAPTVGGGFASASLRF